MARKTTIIRKQEIINTAAELLITDGLKELTIKNLAKKNKISESAIYRHFTSKREILTGLIEQFERALILAIETPIRVHEDPLRCLKEIMRTHIQFAQKKKSLLFAITSSAIHMKDSILRKRILKATEHYNDKIKNILIAAKKKKQLREDIDIPTASFAFFGLIRSASAHFALTNYTALPQKKFNTLWNIYVHGIEKKTNKK